MTAPDIIVTLENALPTEMKPFAYRLASFIEEIWTKKETKSKLEVTEDEVVSALKCLSGQELRLGNSLVSFGNNGQFGDICFRDVVYGNVIHINLVLQSKSSDASVDVTSKKGSSPIPAPNALDVFTMYERGVHQLLQMLKEDPDQIPVILTYQQRLQENLHSSRLFGDTPTLRAERSEIIYRLNNISVSKMGVSFNDLMRR